MDGVEPISAAPPPSAATVGQFMQALQRQQIELATQNAELRQTQVLLRASEARLRSQFQLAPTPTFVWEVAGEEFTLIDVNPAAERMTLGKARQFLGMTAPQICGDRPDLIEHFHACLQQRTAIVYETAYHACDTGRDWVIVFTFAFVAPDMILLYADDITEHKMAEAALRDEQAKMVALLENIDGGIWSVDANYCLVAGNSAFFAETAQAFGRSFAVGERVLWENGDPERVRLWQTYYTRALRGERFSVEMQRRVGDSNWAEYRLNPIRDRTGAVTGVTVFGRDITERRLAETTLRESAERFRLAFENANDGVCLVGLDGRLLRVNDRMCEIFGYSRQEMEDRTVSDLTHPDYLEVSPQVIQRAVQGQSDRDEFEKLYLHRDGRTVWGRVSSSLVRNDCGEPLYFISHVQDITGRKQAEDERQLLQAQLAQAQKMETVGRLAGGIAHDFNNMLAVILMRTEMALQSADLTAPLHRDLTTVYATAQRSAALVRQLLGFARKQMIAPRVIDLNTALEGTLPMLHKLLGENLELVWHPGADLWRVKMDPAQVDQILTNLCINARDAIDGVGTLTIATANVVSEQAHSIDGLALAPGDYVMLAVSDNGSGMDAQTLAHIFEPFFTTKSVGKGVGLGLATVDGIVQQNHGQIQVTSTPGVGTTFRIYLPRHEEAAPGAAPARPDATLAPQSRGETVLLVEDETTLLNMGVEALEFLGYQVLAAPSPGAALELAATHPAPIHLLLTDVIMPEMNGHELAERIALLQPGIKRLFVSGYPADYVSQRDVLEGAVNFLQKPYVLNTLAATVRRVLDSA